MIFSKNLTLTATRGVEDRFNDLMFREIDVDSPLGPALGYISVVFYEQKPFDQVERPAVYFRYVDDTFFVFECRWIVTVSTETRLVTLSVKIYY